jgi:hypothetical protein
MGGQPELLLKAAVEGEEGRVVALDVRQDVGLAVGGLRLWVWGGRGGVAEVRGAGVW